MGWTQAENDVADVMIWLRSNHGREVSYADIAAGVEITNGRRPLRGAPEPRWGDHERLALRGPGAEITFHDQYRGFAPAGRLEDHPDVTLPAAGLAVLPAPGRRRQRHPVPGRSGRLNTMIKTRVNIGLINDHWDDLLRVAGSLQTGAVHPAELFRYLTGGGTPTPIGRAPMEPGKLDRSTYLACYFNDELLRRRVNTQLNRQEARHTLARKIFHRQKGELRQKYKEGQEDQLGRVSNVLVADVTPSASDPKSRATCAQSCWDHSL
ncbi:Tn3 family transposase [Streptosporangium sp. NPDC002544]|uniref:Tn3 family transposase n=1 Tax=Streptosporangium sp. NPDC002544 TaxID=3154538 RepID=UPI003317DAD3